MKQFCDLNIYIESDGSITILDVGYILTEAHMATSLWFFVAAVGTLVLGFLQGDRLSLT